VIFVINKPFKEMTREDIVLFLDSVRKPEATDPLHKWIGTYNQDRGLLIRFFKWLYYQNMEPDRRPNPAVIENLPQSKIKETSIYKPSVPSIYNLKNRYWG
jgi:hypothetical protein